MYNLNTNLEEDCGCDNDYYSIINNSQSSSRLV